MDEDEPREAAPKSEIPNSNAKPDIRLSEAVSNSNAKPNIQLSDVDNPSDKTILRGRIPPGVYGQAEQGLTWVLAIALALSLVGLVSVAVMPPQTGTPFTEFYLLGPNGTASEYPTALSTNETGAVIVGVSNHERKPVEYRMRVTWNGTQTQDRTVSVEDGETAEFRTNLTAPANPGVYRVRFLLYNETSPDPYMRTSLLVQVRDERASYTTATPANETPPSALVHNSGFGEG